MQQHLALTTSRVQAEEGLVVAAEMEPVAAAEVVAEVGG